MFRTFWTINFVFLLLCCHSLAQEKRTDFFANRVQPILKKHCVKCHGPKRKKSKLRLDEPRYILKGGRGGAVVVPCEPERSPLILAVSYTDPDLQMPPKKKLSQSDIETLTEWVQHGAVMPGVTGTVTGVSAPPPTFDWTERLKHWCWQAVADVSPPTGKGSPIDRFLAVEREQRGLSTAARANRRTALRRLYFDLSGLPPSPEELRAALADDAPDAWGRTVDRLLESPHFGEQWGRHWLDLMRYAETKGYEFDFDLPNAWRYRDYVIRAFNEDVPYDQIVREHVAGDLLRAPRRNLETGFNESVLGTGFWTFGEAGHSPVDTRADQLEQTANRIDVFSKAFLGLTVACARCHDHKFDAISAKDYYALSGYLHSSSYRQVRFESELQNKDVVLELESLRREAAVALGSPLADALRPAVRSMDRALMNVLQKKESALTGLQLEWAAQLKRSLDDESDPMHPLARFADAQDGATLEKIRLNRSQSSPLLPPNALVIADYSNSQTPWLTNGPVFGSRASRIGDIVLSSDPEWPIKRIGTNSAAVRDPFWDDLSLKTGTQIESGGVVWQQAGRTIRTPSFQLKTGVLHYLVKGPFHGLVVLDDYRIVKGPLYNSAARSFKAKQALRWVRHDLSDYKGKVAHIEFSAEASSPFELLCVIDSKGAPSPIKARYANDWITSVFDQRDGVSLSELTRQYRRLFERALKRLSKNELSLSPDASDLIDWIVRHPKLFPIDEKGRQQLSATATVFIQRRSALRERMLSQSATAPALMDGSGLTEHILIRGNHKTPGGPAPRQPLTGTSGVVLQPIVSGSGRLQLSEHLTNPKHPLLARVMVNRIWHHVFGRGLVASTDNFGALGERPSHPELLDWLSGEFVRNGWSVKTLIRELVMTDTYRLDSNPVAESSALDPLNLYLHQMPLRRMTAEVLRDHLLKTSGRLDTTLSGRSVPVHLTSFMQGRGRPAKSGPLDGAGRRSIYIAIRRNFLAPFLLAFDFPLPISTVGRRTVSNVPAQALTLMNDPFVLNMANHWARQNLLTQPTLTPTARVSELYEGGFGRPATDAESKRALSFIHDLAPDARNEKEVLAAWTSFCHVLINAKEFWYVR